MSDTYRPGPANPVYVLQLWSGSCAAKPSVFINLSSGDRAKQGCPLKLAGFILVNLAASWRKSSTNLASDPPFCAISCNILSATSTLNLTASSEAAVRYLVPNKYSANAFSVETHYVAQLPNSIATSHVLQSEQSHSLMESALYT